MKQPKLLSPLEIKVPYIEQQLRNHQVTIIKPEKRKGKRVNIRRIEADIIECFFAAEELEKIPISAQEIQGRTPAARKFIEHLVMMAAGTVDYKPQDESNLYMTVIDDPIGTIVYLYEGDVPERFMQKRGKLEKHAKDTFAAHLVEDYLKPLLKKKNYQNNVNMPEHIHSGVQEVIEDAGTHKVADAKENKLGDMLFCFTTIRDIISLAGLLPQLPSTDSALYSYENRYYIYLTITEYTDQAKKEYFRTCTTTLEFAKRLSNPKEIETIREHGECLIHHKALPRLKGRIERDMGDFRDFYKLTKGENPFNI